MRARDAILMKLRKATADGGSLFRSHDAPAPIDAAPSAVTHADGSGLTLAQTFGENLTVVLGSFEIVEDSGGVAQRILMRIQSWKEENGATCFVDSELLSWAPNELPIANLPQQLEERGVSLLVPSDMNDEGERHQAAALSVGLTGVDAAFAGTGSMVLVPGPGKSQAASLLPLHHIALVPVSKIFPTLESWLASLRSEGSLDGLFRDRSQLAFITGPSKSADIELNLTLGVHGPRDVHAIVFDDGR
jgi:L-lactate dehydrogenase complex protein LldG